MIEEAKLIAAAAEKAAKNVDLSIVVSIVDTHGNPVLLHRMDGAPLHSLDMAFRKAYTAASFDVATEELTDQVQAGQPLYGLAVNSGSKLIAFGGGAPTSLKGGDRVGVGISGGTSQEDIEILREALKATIQP
ncbi:heme-binding protein [Arthrobacter sp. NA-172]|uniref:GlcG/HbpS family heme-binding protein n=1 Tax=Arthrobacter sp. NA-172 TaxID=3367524 RepID=UPI003754CF92